MFRTPVVVGCLIALLAPSGSAQEHQHAKGEKLGAVHFATSCNAAAQKEFDQAVALLHSFQFNHAIQGFNAALKSNPACGIAHWGIALSQWSNPFAAGMKDKSQLQAELEGTGRGERARGEKAAADAHTTGLTSAEDTVQTRPSHA